MSNAISGKTRVRNTRTGQTAVFISTWLNKWSDQEVVNIRLNGMAGSWLASNVEVC